MTMFRQLKFKKSHLSDAITGTVTVLGINILLIFIFLALNIFYPSFMGAVFSIGLLQLIYIIPLLRWSVKRRIKGFTKGLIIGFLFTLAVNAGCFLVTLRYISTIGR
jgi:hypothetical protein